LLSGLILKVIRMKDTKNILAEWQTWVEVCRSRCFISAACVLYEVWTICGVVGTNVESFCKVNLEAGMSANKLIQ